MCYTDNKIKDSQQTIIRLGGVSMSVTACISLLFFVCGVVFLLKPQLSWYLAEGRAYGKYGEKEMPKERKKAHLIRGAVLFLLGLYGLVKLIQSLASVLA